MEEFSNEKSHKEEISTDLIKSVMSKIITGELRTDEEVKKALLPLDMKNLKSIRMQILGQQLLAVCKSKGIHFL